MLTGKIALVTGGGRGIGRAIALELAAQGAFVLINYNGSGDAAAKTAEMIFQAGGKAELYQCNIAEDAGSRAMIQEILEKHGKVDILVNNAGITRDGLLLKMSEEDFDQVLDVNLKGAFHMIKYLSRSFIRQRKGKIINISSVSGVLGNAGQANYCAAKAGLIGLTKSTARELASRGICVNAIAPGFIDTQMTRQLPERAREALLAGIPLGRMGSAQEVAKLAAFLADEASDYITGQVISIDGGMAM